MDLEAIARLKTEAELKLLQAQIHPHFIFNALNTIISLIRIDPLKGKDLLFNLATFLRFRLKKEKEISLREELTYVEAYLSIEAARYRDKLKVNYNIEPEVDLDVKLPPFTIQPLVENAIKHGLKPKLKDGEISINIFNEESGIIISVKDNGIGMNGNVTKISDDKNCGLGLYLVNERLRKFYGDNSMLHIESDPSLGTVITFKMPDLSGLETAKLLSTFNRPPFIVFATAYDEYAIEAFELGAIDYILKPFEEKRIAKTLMRIINLKNNQNEWNNAINKLSQFLLNKKIFKKLPVQQKEGLIILFRIVIFFTVKPGKAKLKFLH